MWATTRLCENTIFTANLTKRQYLLRVYSSADLISASLVSGVTSTQFASLSRQIMQSHLITNTIINLINFESQPPKLSSHLARFYRLPHFRSDESMKKLRLSALSLMFIMAVKILQNDKKLQFKCFGCKSRSLFDFIIFTIHVSCVVQAFFNVLLDWL